MIDHLIPYLRALAAGRHDDVSIAVDAVIEIERLTRERDEARAAVERLGAENEHLHRAHQAACEGGDLLRVEIERLREALRKTACACSSTRDCPSPWPSDISGWCQHLNARMALEGKSLERKP